MNLLLPVHFLRMGLSGIIAITNSNVERTSPWKIPLWISTSTKIFYPGVNSTFQFLMASGIIIIIIIIILLLGIFSRFFLTGGLSLES